MTDDLFPRYGSDLPVPKHTLRRFVYSCSREQQKLLDIICKHLSSFRQDWPVEIRRKEESVDVWIDGTEAFSYDGVPRLCKSILEENFARDGDFAIKETGPRRHHPWSFLWFRLPLRRLPEARIQLSHVPDKSIPWRSFGFEDAHLGYCLVRLIRTPSGLQIRDSTADRRKYHAWSRE